MKAVGYIRVSTEEQKRDGWNLEADRERITEIAAANGWELGPIYDDGGLQGDDPDRPGFNALISGLDWPDVIVMRSLDRLSRDTWLYALATRAIRRAGVRVETFTGPVNLDTASGELAANVEAAIARFEKVRLAERVKQAKVARSKAGKHPGGGRPFGYRYADDGLVVDPTEAAIVRRMFEMAQGGSSQRRIAHALNAEGIVTSRGGPWTQSVVARLLGNAMYLGKIRRRVNGGWELHDGQHEAILKGPDGEALWQGVNQARATPERRAGGRPLTANHLLTRGILRCGRCGSAIIPYALRGRTDVYRCAGRHTHGPGYCEQTPIRRE